jgi:hypothetical protein
MRLPIHPADGPDLWLDASIWLSFSAPEDHPLTYNSIHAEIMN